MVLKPRSITLIGIIRSSGSLSSSGWYSSRAEAHFAWRSPTSAIYRNRFHPAPNVFRRERGQAGGGGNYASAGYLPGDLLHIDQWLKSSLLAAHIWVIIYTVEPIMLFLKNRRAEASGTALNQRDLFSGLKVVCCDGCRRYVRQPGFH
jgi:hypothetical protein